MKTFTIEVTTREHNILSRAAKKDGITVKQLVAKQLKYYISVVIDDFYGSQAELTDVEKAALRELILDTKDNYFISIGK